MAPSVQKLFILTKPCLGEGGKIHARGEKEDRGAFVEPQKKKKETEGPKRVGETSGCAARKPSMSIRRGKRQRKRVKKPGCSSP